MQKLINNRINEIKIYSLNDLKNEYYKLTNGHWFDKSTMKFFKCRLSEELFYGPRFIYFISSEQGPDNIRAYSVRSFDPNNGEIDTVGEFQEYSTGAQAKKAAKNLINNQWGA